MPTDAAGTGVGFLYVVPIVIARGRVRPHGGRGARASWRSGCSRSGRRSSRRSRWTPWGTSRARPCSCSSAGSPDGWPSACGRPDERVEASARTSSCARPALHRELRRLHGPPQRELGADPGVDAGGAHGAPVHRLRPPRRPRADRARGALVTTGDFTASFTNRYRTKDGGWRWIEWASKADMERELIYAAARDVTDRRRGRAGPQGGRGALPPRLRGLRGRDGGGGRRGRERQPDHPGQREPGPDNRHVGGGAGGRAHVGRAGRSRGPGPHRRGDARSSTTGEPRCSAASSGSCAPTAAGCGWTSRPRWSVSEDGRVLYRLSQAVDIDARKRLPSSSSTSPTTTPSAASSTGAASSRSSSASSATPPTRRPGCRPAAGRGRFKNINDTLGHAVGTP